MGVPGFYSWLIRRYPLVKHMIDKEQVPEIDYLYLDMNGIIYKCVKDDEIMFKSQILPKEMQQIWLDVFNYINMIVNILKPNKMVVLGLDGVAPRAKMNNQRSRRFKSARDHSKFMAQFQEFNNEVESLQNFKNNSISPGTAFMDELGKNLQFFIKKKIQEDDYWKSLSVIFTSSSSPGQGEHKIMQFIRANKDNFNPEDSHCLYGADADLIMLSMTLPLKNLCIIREQYVPGSEDVKISQTKKYKTINFEMIFVTILREYFEIQYGCLKQEMKVQFDLNNVLKDFVFLFFFIGNDFLPRCMAYNIRQTSIEDLIQAFKQFLVITEDYVVGPEKLNMKALTLLANVVATRQSKFIDEKVQDYEKFSENKNQFEKELNKIIQQKAIKQKQFIQQLKMYYMNNQAQARNIYYDRYFNIKPAEQPEQFYKILNNYLFGLQFVYEYYFINLPSWQWFYPYYCAPLVSDLYFYLNYLSLNNYDLPKLDPGTPSEPFKQLLCILPKQSSDLLPSPFKKYFVSPESILRAPVDYYPDNFEEQPYGSTRSHQFIALIPFLDLNVVNKAYDQAITQVSQQDLQRNQLKLSSLFEYDVNAPEITIQSKFSSIPSKTCPIRETKVNLRDRIKWGKNTPEISPIDTSLLKMPTLNCKQFTATLRSDKRKKYVVVELNAEVPKCKLDQEVFFGYPLEKSGKTEAILSLQGFASKSEFHEDNYYLQDISRDFNDSKFIKQRPKSAFQLIKQYLIRQERYQFDWKSIQSIIFVKQTQEYVRCLDGSFKPVYYGSQRTRYEIVPSPLVSATKVYTNTADKIEFKNLESEFGNNQDVIIFPKNNGSYAQKGKVVGFKGKNVLVKTGEKIQPIEQKIISKIVHTRQIYFTLQLCSFILQIQQEVLLTLLESVNLILNVPDMPPSIDIGLNFIHRSDQKLVPNLVRINFDTINERNRQNPQKLFRFMDISLKGFQLIIEYKKKFPNIIKFIQARYHKLIQNKDEKGRINWREPIKLSDIYTEQEQEKSIKSLMNVYLWLIKKEETHMPLSSIYSKQISKKNIQKLQEMFLKSVTQGKKNKYVESRVEQIDPNYLFSRRLASFGKMHLQKIPKPITIRDQIICLKPEFFGEFGVVVGFDENKFEVIFNKPSFGKTDLNGLCHQLWAGRFYERDLFNFDTWPDVMSERYQTKNRAENIGWDGTSGRTAQLPKFQEKPLRGFEDIKLLSEKYQFSKEFLQFVEQAKKNQKVQKLDRDFVVVDNKKRNYALKYDQEKTTIPKQYVEKVANDRKFIQKPIANTNVSQLNVEHKSQVIENKTEQQNNQQKQKPTQTQAQVEAEDDGDDILN